MSICGLMDLEMKLNLKGSPEPSMDLLSDAWCSSAIQVFKPEEVFRENPTVELKNETSAAFFKSENNLDLDDDKLKSEPQWKLDDLKSWLWLQQAIHPELDYDLSLRKKWFSSRNPPWKGMSIKKWIKELKQKRKEKQRLQKAEVHAAISVAGVAAALAAIAAENTVPSQENTSKQSAVATAAALVAAQCAQVAEAVGAKREQLDLAISAAMTDTDANNIVTLTAAAATSLRGAATLKGRTYRTRGTKGNAPALLIDKLDFDFGQCRASLAKGEEILVETSDGKCRIRSVSVVLNRDAKVVIRVKKIHMLMALSGGKESTLYDLHTSPLEEPIQEADASYSICMTTSQGKIKLKIDDYVQYKRWISTIHHMIKLSTTFSS